MSNQGCLKALGYALAVAILVFAGPTVAAQAPPPVEEAGTQNEDQQNAALPFSADALSGFVIAAEMPYRANLRATGIFINVFHIPRPTEDLLKSLEENKGKKAVTVIVCRGDQKGAIDAYRDLCDQFIMEALFMTPSQESPTEGDVIWPGVDHLIVNYLRSIRKYAQGKRVIVAVPMTAREILGASRTRAEPFEELEWMVYALIGADFDGLLWGHVRTEKWWQKRLSEFETALKTYADRLAASSPVDWVTASEGQPCSALACEDRLFVLLLNPEYMKITPDGRSVMVPIGVPERDCEVHIRLPDGLTVGPGATLHGESVEFTSEGDGVTARLHYAGGGAMLVFPIDGGEDQSPDLP